MDSLHTPQELVTLSNAAHLAEGVVLAFIALLIIAQGFGYLQKTWQHYLVPGIALLASLILSGFLFLDHLHELPRAWYWITTDMQQQQHLLIGAILGVTSVLALIGLKLKQKWLSVALPLAFVAIGIVFLVHPQHGTDNEAARALLVHRVAGTSLISAGLSLLGVTFLKKWYKILSVLAGILLLVSAGLFVSYREPLMESMDMDGMNMNNSTNMQSHATYSLNLMKAGMNYQPNKPTELMFDIRDQNNKVLKDFDTVHEKVMHLIVVRKDRMYFQHVHPSFDKDSGMFAITNFTFPTDGEYRVFADFTPIGAQKDDMGMKLAVTPYKDVKVGTGNYTPQALGEDKLTSNVGGLDTSLSLMNGDTPNPIPYAGMPLPIVISVNKNGAAYKNLQPYLGALGHMVVLGPNLEFVHAHASEDTTYQNGLIIFTVDFPDPGQYKIYLQTQSDSKVITTDYNFTTLAMPDSTQQNNQSMDDMNMEGMSH
jgi:hypothetical protein